MLYVVWVTASLTNVLVSFWKTVSELITSFNRKRQSAFTRGSQHVGQNFKGIGWKEASHFLRNVGLLDVAILDKHILRLMHHYKLIEDMPKGWTRARYEAHEQLLIPVVQKLHMDLGEMDLYCGTLSRTL